jgi:hypothetical protein
VEGSSGTFGESLCAAADGTALGALGTIDARQGDLRADDKRAARLVGAADAHRYDKTEDPVEASATSRRS